MIETNPTYQLEMALMQTDTTLPFMSLIARLQMKDSYPFLCDWITGNVISERGHKGNKNDPTHAIDEDNIAFLNPEQKKFTECAKCN